MPILIETIWAAIVRGIPWIIGYFTVDKVVSHLGASADDKKKLLDSVAKQCKELNLSPDQCNALLTQTQADASSSPLADTLKLAVGGWLLLQVVSSFSKK